MSEWKTGDEIMAERLVLESAVAETFIALRASPAFKAYEAAEFKLIEHRCLYGDPTSNEEPGGLLHAEDFDNVTEHGDDGPYVLPEEFPDDDERSDYENEVIL